jgi:hypothetical protein
VQSSNERGLCHRCTVQRNLFEVHVICWLCSVVALLTKSFMSNGKCLDQYNLAICADRRSQRRILAPMIFDDLPNVPVYMSSIQWFDCKWVLTRIYKCICWLMGLTEIPALLLSTLSLRIAALTASSVRNHCSCYTPLTTYTDNNVNLFHAPLTV